MTRNSSGQAKVSSARRGSARISVRGASSSASWRGQRRIEVALHPLHAVERAEQGAQQRVRRLRDGRGDRHRATRRGGRGRRGAPAPQAAPCEHGRPWRASGNTTSSEPAIPACISSMTASGTNGLRPGASSRVGTGMRPSSGERSVLLEHVGQIEHGVRGALGLGALEPAVLRLGDPRAVEPQRRHHLAPLGHPLDADEVAPLARPLDGAAAVRGVRHGQAQQRLGAPAAEQQADGAAHRFAHEVEALGPRDPRHLHRVGHQAPRATRESPVPAPRSGRSPACRSGRPGSGPAPRAATPAKASAVAPMPWWKTISGASPAHGGGRVGDLEVQRPARPVQLAGAAHRISLP